MAELARIRTVLAGWPGAPGVSTNHYADESVLGWSVIVPALREQVHLAWEHLAPFMPGSMTATLAVDTDIIEDTTGELIRTVTDTEVFATTGTGAGAYLSTVIGLCVTWITEGVVAGKHVRGRTYIIPLASEALGADGTPHADAVEAAEGYAAQMNAGSVSYPMAVWSRPFEGSAGPPVKPARLGGGHYVTSSRVADKFAVLRSRRD